MGEVGPEEVCELLERSQCAESDARTRAEARLRQLEQEAAPGFVRSAIEVLKQGSSLSEGTRLLAAILLKNCVGSSWSKLVGSREWLAFPEEERISARSELLPLLALEPSERVCKQLSLLVANVARFDFLSSWPDLLSSLLSSSRWVSHSTSAHQKLRFLRCSKHVVRALSGRTSLSLASHPSAFVEASERARSVRHHCKQLFSPLVSEWSDHSHHQSSQPERHQLACKCLQVISAVIWHMDALDDLENGSACQFFFERALHLMQTTDPNSNGESARSLRLLAECIFAALERSPLEFSQYLGPFVSTFMQHMLTLPQDALATDSERALVLTRFLYRALNEPVYKESYAKPRQDMQAASSSPQHPQPQRSQAVECATAAFQPLFDDSSVISTLVARYFVLTQSEIEEWQAESEAQYQPSAAHAGSSDADSPRPCAELLLRAMLERQPELVSNQVIQLAAQAQTKSLSDPQEALYRDACYRAVGLLGQHSSNVIDFNSWFANELQPMLNVTGEEASLLQARVLRARALWLLGCFEAKLDTQTKRSALELLLRHVEPSNPLVALHAVEALDDFFTPAVLCDAAARPPQAAVHLFESLQPDTESQSLLIEAGPYALRRLFELAVTLGSSEALVQVLSVISCFFATMGAQNLLPLLPEVSQYLPRLWEAVSQAASAQHTGSEARMHSLLMSLFTQLVRLLGTNALHEPSVCNVLYPLLDIATDPANDSYLYLVHDGLKLWLSALRNCTQIEEQLMQRFPKLITVLSREHIDTGHLILQGYLLVGGQEFVSANAANVARAVDGAVSRLIHENENDVQEGSSRREEEILSASVAADLLIQLAPQQGMEALKPTMQKVVQHYVTSVNDSTGQVVSTDPITARGVINILARVRTTLIFSCKRHSLAPCFYFSLALSSDPLHRLQS